MFPTEAGGLEFLDDPEWFEAAVTKPHYVLLNQALKQTRTCRECHEAKAPFWGSPKCPGMIPEFDRARSLSSKGIFLLRNICKFRKAAETTSRVENYLVSCGVSSRNLELFTLDNFNPGRHAQAKAAYDVALSYVQHWQSFGEEEGNGLFFYSKFPRVGKTHLAIGIAQEITHQYKRPFRYVNVPKFLTDYKTRIGSRYNGRSLDQEDASTMIKDVAEFPGLLVLDALASEIPTDSTVNALITILQNRVDNRLPMLITSLHTLLGRKELDQEKALITECMPYIYENWGQTGLNIPLLIQSCTQQVCMRAVPSFLKEIKLPK